MLLSIECCIGSHRQKLSVKSWIFSLLLCSEPHFTVKLKLNIKLVRPTMEKVPAAMEAIKMDVCSIVNKFIEIE